MKKIVVCCLIFSILIQGFVGVHATTTNDKLKETSESISELEKEKEEAESKADELLGKTKELENNLIKLNQQLADTSTQITQLEGQIVDKQTQIQVSSANLETENQNKDKQYEKMKKRIRFMYEKGDNSTLAILLSSTSMSELLNKAEYIEAISSYDRQMLENYKTIILEIKKQKEQLEKENQELSALKISMDTKKEQLDTVITSVKNTMSENNSTLLMTQSEIASYQEKIEKMKAYEDELEAKKIKEAAQAAKDAAESVSKPSSNQTGTTDNSAIHASTSDLSMLAAIVECEAGGESDEGKLAVASVVVNRVKSGSFPNSISGVIYQSSQFSPVASGRFALVLSQGASLSCVQAAQSALSGNTNVTALYFLRNTGSISGTVIGNHVFY